MNILRHKSWHVRTKENMARVRRDEAKAAEEAKSREERVKIAEQEDRVNRLKRNAGSTTDDPLAMSAEEYEKHAETSAHVNFFAEIEAQERKNLTQGNSEYQAEKKNEQNEWESKMGIMKRFAEDTHDLSGETHWWQKIERIRPEPQDDVGPSTKPKRKSEKEIRREVRRQLKAERKEKKKKKRRRRDSSSSSDNDEREAKKRRLEQLREERRERERIEQKRTQQLLNPKAEPVDVEPQIKKQRPTYSDQFNPEFVRRR
ncbi:Cir-N domain-containing protein [Aphelenchoides besseyi]|nr:Cir-N domain-containing protein [Aphelenchoides besseyi]KAI6217284.1 Cir-N domain-containing protein [Aphelenchoides besseyi]